MIKDVLVYLDGSKEDEVRLSYAEPIAQRHDAFLTGLLCVEIPDVVSAGDGVFSVGQVAAELQQEAEAQGDKYEKELDMRFAKHEFRSDLRRVSATPSFMGQTIANEARLADLFVATRPYKHYSEKPEIFEHVLFNSGRGCLFVPPAIPASDGPYKNIVLGWRNSKETARAVADAVPFLQKADQVTVAIVSDDEAPEERGIEPGADIARHLDRHGVNVEVRNINGWSDAAAALLNEVGRIDADMLVMGGYGHSRFREWVLGGATREVLSKAEVPVLMAH
ncbi:universal stress protein family protein [Maritalea mobilis]|uniref:Universal stress protein family protein n=1 Tax=Maritalea mobilis TaxID=483324 RepID=A0A4R6VRT3_9HYPH|nr:universal stress protein [Maritalea mobilis]TDQ66743.1 universal stress protein family protein [Maritalea mobilis]